MTPEQTNTAALIVDTRLRAHARGNPVSTRELLATLKSNGIYMSGSSLRDLIRDYVMLSLEADNICLVSTNADGYWTAASEKDAVSVYVAADTTLKRAQTGLANAARMHKWAAQWTHKYEDAK